MYAKCPNASCGVEFEVTKERVVKPPNEGTTPVWITLKEYDDLKRELTEMKEQMEESLHDLLKWEER